MNFPDTPLHQFDPAPPAPDDRPLGDDITFDSPAKEALFQQAWHVLKNTEDPRAKPSWWFFAIIVGVVAILIAQAGQFDSTHLALLIGVIVLHELGHFVAMKVFGYTDAKLFFIPLFAALVRGRRHSAPAWQQAVTILMGPLPGLAAAMGLYLAFRDTSPPWLLQLIVMLLFINTFNLLPIGFADGGRFLNLVVYSRNVWVETLMHLVSAGLFAWLAYWQGHIVLGVLATMMLLSAPMVFRMGLMIVRLRREGLEMPDTVSALEPIHGRMLFAATYDVLGRANAATLAHVMRQLHDRVLVPSPGFLATVGFLLLYLAGWLMTVGTLGAFLEDYMGLRNRLVMVQQQPEYQWKRDADQLRLKARRLRGPAQEDAIRKAQDLEKQYLDWRNEVIRKAAVYEQAFFAAQALAPQQHGDDEEEDEKDEKKSP